MATKKTKKICKTDLVKELAKSRGISVAEAGRVLNDTLGIIQKNLKKGNSVTFMGFGTFSVKKRAARKGRNPQTGEEIKIKATKVIKFKAGSKLSASVKK